MTSFKDIAGIIPITKICDPPSESYDLNKLLCSRVYVGIDDGLKMYMPMIVERSIFKKRKEKLNDLNFFSLKSEKLLSSDNAILSYPYEVSLSTENRYTVQKEKLYEVTKLSPFSGKAINIDHFDISRLSSIHEFVENEGSLYLKIQDTEAMKAFLHKQIHTLESTFRYTVSGKYDLNTSSHPQSNVNPTEMLTLIVGFHNLRYTVPIYDFKHVSGMAVSVHMVWPETSAYLLESKYKARFYFVVSNYESNILEVDGQVINNVSNINPALLDACIKVATEEERRRGTIPDLVKKYEKFKRDKAKAFEKRMEQADKEPKQKIDASDIAYKPYITIDSSKYVNFDTSTYFVGSASSTATHYLR